VGRQQLREEGRRFCIGSQASGGGASILTPPEVEDDLMSLDSRIIDMSLLES